MREYSFDLYDQNGVRITTAGGIAKVVAANAFSEVALLNEDGSALANPISLSNGETLSANHNEYHRNDTIIWIGDNFHDHSPPWPGMSSH